MSSCAFRKIRILIRDTGHMNFNERVLFSSNCFDLQSNLPLGNLLHCWYIGVVFLMHPRFLLDSMIALAPWLGTWRGGSQYAGCCASAGAVRLHSTMLLNTIEPLRRCMQSPVRRSAAKGT